MVIESLRYWAETCQVDEFRFDLATALARDLHGFDGGAAFFAAIKSDPALADVKLTPSHGTSGRAVTELALSRHPGRNGTTILSARYGAIGGVTAA
jgi:pullulanase/glycogen debranching enzyme